MKIALLAAATFALTACGSYQFAGGAPSPTPALGTISGHVVAVPCAPVEQPGNACTSRPLPNLEIDYVAGTTVEARTLTNADGTYAVALMPGTYAVRFKTYMRVVSGPLSVTVAVGSSTTANYVLDTGIRVPVPQQ
jgi:hypothetical protein